MNMRLIRLCIAILFILMLESSVDSEVGFYHFDTRTAEKLMFSAVNRIRLSNSLPILRRDEKLEKAARIHASDMVSRNFFDHINPDGEGPRERALSLGLPYPVSENLGVLSSYGLTLEEVVDELMYSLMESPKHRSNILSPCITDIGISFAQDKDNNTSFIKLEKIGSSHLGFGTVVICQEFMRKGLKSYDPDPFPKDIKKDQSIVFNAQTYRDFDTVFIEIVEKQNGKSIEINELVLFERTFQERLNFSQSGDFHLKISGNLYNDNNQFINEELATFPIHVD